MTHTVRLAVFTFIFSLVAARPNGLLPLDNSAAQARQEETSSWIGFLDDLVDDLIDFDDIANKKEKIKETFETSRKKFRANTEDFAKDVSKSSVNLVTCYLEQVDNKQEIQALLDQIRLEQESGVEAAADSVYGAAKKACRGHSINISLVVDLYIENQSSILKSLTDITYKLIDLKEFVMSSTK